MLGQFGRESRSGRPPQQVLGVPWSAWADHQGWSWAWSQAVAFNMLMFKDAVVKDKASSRTSSFPICYGRGSQEAI